MAVGRIGMSDGSIQENQFSDLPFWLCRNWSSFAFEKIYGMSYWLEIMEPVLLGPPSPTDFRF